MAGGFGNAGIATHGSFAFATVTAGIQQITAPGWTAAVGDITPIDHTNGNLRRKVVSGHLDPQSITITYFMDPANHVSPTSTQTGTLDITYPTQAGAWSMQAGMTSFKMGDLIEDDVMVGECEFMLLGNAVLDDTAV